MHHAVLNVSKQMQLWKIILHSITAMPSFKAGDQVINGSKEFVAQEVGNRLRVHDSLPLFVGSVHSARLNRRDGN
jgi:hypothetical protein